MIPIETERFQLWMDTEMGDRWFTYEGVDIRANTFCIKSNGDDDEAVFWVWSRGEVRYKGSDHDQAMMAYERERKKGRA